MVKNAIYIQQHLCLRQNLLIVIYKQTKQRLSFSISGEQLFTKYGTSSSKSINHIFTRRWAGCQGLCHRQVNTFGNYISNCGWFFQLTFYKEKKIVWTDGHFQRSKSVRAILAEEFPHILHQVQATNILLWPHIPEYICKQIVTHIIL